jgi:hypothetical protein
MATAKELKSRLRANVEMRMDDVRKLGTHSSFYADSAYGAIWAANVVDAITDKERDNFLAQLKQQKHGTPAPTQQAA